MTNNIATKFAGVIYRDNYRTGCRYVSNCQQQSYSAVHSHRRSFVPPTYERTKRWLSNKYFLFFSRMVR